MKRLAGPDLEEDDLLADTPDRWRKKRKAK